MTKKMKKVPPTDLFEYPTYKWLVPPTSLTEPVPSTAVQRAEQTMQLRGPKIEEVKEEKMPMKHAWDTNLPNEKLYMPDLTDDEDNHSDEVLDGITEAVNWYKKDDNFNHILKVILRDLSGYLDNALCHDGEGAVRGDRLYKEVRAIEMDLGLEGDPKLEPQIIQFLTRLYGYSEFPKLFYFHFASLDVYKELVEKFIKKDISIDEEFMRVGKINFSQLRKERKDIYGVYIPMDNVVFLLDAERVHGRYNTRQLYHELIEFLDALPNKKEITHKEIGESIEIDGIKYSKRVFENIIECKLESFIQNMEIEQMLDKDDINNNLETL